MEKDILVSLLHQYFGYSQFRPQQREVITNALNKNDSVVIWPTSAGK